MRNRRPLLNSQFPILIVVLLLATGLRLYRLGSPGFWSDEARVALWATEPLWQFVQRTLETVELPTGTLLVGLFLRLSPTEFAARLPAAWAGIVAVALTYALGRTLFGRRVGVLGALLLAVSPLEIRYAQEVRYYTLVSTLVLLLTYQFVRLLNGRRAGLGYPVAAVLALLTHVFSLAVLVVQGVVALALALWPRLRRWTRWRVPVRPRPTIHQGVVVLVLMTILLVVYVPMVTGILHSLTLKAGLYAPPGYSPVKRVNGDPTPGFGVRDLIWHVYYRVLKWFSLPTPLGDGLPAAHDDCTAMILIGTPPDDELRFRLVLLLAGMALLAPPIKPLARSWMLFGLLLLPLTILALVTEFYGPRVGILNFAVRRLLFLLPFWLLLLARGLDSLAAATIAVVRRWLKRGALPAWGRSALAGMLLLAFVGGLWADSLAGYYRRPREDWRGAARYLAAHASLSDLIVAASGYEADPLRWYLRQTRLSEQIRNLQEDGWPNSPPADNVWYVVCGQEKRVPSEIVVRSPRFVGPWGVQAY